MTVSNDQPIALPTEDRFGLDPFAAAIAQSIAGMEAPAGVVLAINGAWGAGKSSAINLIRHHLRTPVDQGDIVIVPFNPWWFAGADALTLAFFQELGKAIGPSLPETVRGSLAALGRGVSAAGALAGALANLKAPGLGEVISNATRLFGRLTGKERTVDQEHERLSKALTEQKKRFLVIVDDIDRLSPDDALTIFRLVKSVGRLPNVIYLLAFDRTIAERIVSERFPSEGPSYLEKIVQGAFELPPPLVDVLRQQVLETAMTVMGEPEERKHVRFWNVFYDVVAPYVRTPRDVTRIANHLATAWPAVAGNVDRADFLALTTIQVSDPPLYNVIREHSGELCGVAQSGMQRPQDIAQRYDDLLGISTRPERDRTRVRTALRRLFPRLDSIWSNYWHGEANDWRRDRLLASSDTFRSYFAFAPSEDVVPAERIEALLANAGDQHFVTHTFRTALEQKRRNGSTMAALLLEELTVRASDVPRAGVPTLMTALFALGDELDIDADVLGGWGMSSNQIRLSRLCRFLVNEHFNENERERIYSDAMSGAAGEWAADFTETCLRFLTREDTYDIGPPPVTQERAEIFRRLSLEKISAACADGSIVAHHRLVRLLFAWKRLAGDDAAPVRTFTDAALANDRFVIAMAKQMPSESVSQGMGFDGMGDRVGRRHVRVDLSQYDRILDTERLEARVLEILQLNAAPEEDLAVLRRFRELPRGRHDD